MVDETGEIKDTYRNMPISEFKEILTEDGFIEIFSKPVSFKSSPDVVNHFHIYFDLEMGILIKFTTYKGVNLDGGDMQFCWTPNDVDGFFSESYTNKGLHLGSGGWSKDNVRSCMVDIYPHMRQTINSLKTWGTFVKPWSHSCGLFSLCSRAEIKEYNKSYGANIDWLQAQIEIEEIDIPRFNSFPTEVQAIMNIEYDALCKQHLLNRQKKPQIL